MRRRAVAVAASTFVSLGLAGSAHADDVVVVDPGTVVHTLSPKFLGINSVAFWDSAAGSAASATALAKANLGLVRFAGGVPADYFNWKYPYFYLTNNVPSWPTTPSAASWSQQGPLDISKWTQGLGASLLFQTNYQGNVAVPSGEPNAVNSPANVGAWATYDLAHGIAADFEIGNEEDASLNNAVAPTTEWTAYATAFSAQAKAIHTADPNARVFGPVAQNLWQWAHQGGLPDFLARVGNKTGSGVVDGVSLHYYVGSSYADAVGLPQTWSTGSWNPATFIAQTIASNDSRDLPLYISEWHLGSATGPWNASVGNAIVSADQIGVFALAGVAGEQYFDIHGAGQGSNAYGLLYGSGDTRPLDAPTPTYYAMVLWGKMGSDVLTLTQSADPASAVSSYATSKADGTLQVMAINKTSAATMVDLTLSTYAADSVDVYTLASTGDATSLDVTFNGQLNPNPQQDLPPPVSQPVGGSTFSLSAPAYSVLVLDFHSPSSGSGSGSGGGTGPGSGGGSSMGGTGGTGPEGSVDAGRSGSSDAGGSRGDASTGAGSAGPSSGMSPGPPAGSSGGCSLAAGGSEREARHGVGFAFVAGLFVLGFRRRRPRWCSPRFHRASRPSASRAR